MRKTKLFQAPGSPLVQGYSRLRRPFLSEWASAIAVAVLAIAVYAVGRALLWSQETGVGAGSGADSAAGANPGAQPAIAEVLLAVAPIIVPVLGISALGVWFARNMGWYRPWLAGAVFASLVCITFIEVTNMLPL